MSIEQVIISAIKNNTSLEVVYKNSSRKISPIRFGWKTTEGEGTHKNIFCYQSGGYSSKPLEPDGSMDNFRCWNLEKISSAVPVNDKWRSAKDWTMHKSECIDEVIAGPQV